MKAEVVSMTADNLDMEAIRRGGDILKQGGLVAFPTETVYGLGGDALNPQASMKIYAAKGRPSDNPLIVLYILYDDIYIRLQHRPDRSDIIFHSHPASDCQASDLHNKPVVSDHENRRIHLKSPFHI